MTFKQLCKSKKILAFAILTILCVLNRQSTKASLPEPFLISPYYGPKAVNQPFGGGHNGIDYNLNYEPVLAAADGVISEIEWDSDQYYCHRKVDYACGLGLYVKILHENGYYSLYGHLSTVAFGINAEGAPVKQGQLIATSGNNGNSTNPHLHFEVRTNSGTPVNPDGFWEDGQWAILSRPFPSPNNGEEIIQDDIETSSAGFKKGSGGYPNNQCSGSCQNWTRELTGGYDADYYHTLADGQLVEGNWAMWGTEERGLFNVETYIRNSPEYTAT